VPGLPFEASSEEQYRVVPEGMAGKRGMTEARDALVSGKTFTDAEDVDRDEERVKVEDLTVAERMERIGRAIPESAVE